MNRELIAFQDALITKKVATRFLTDCPLRRDKVHQISAALGDPLEDVREYFTFLKGNLNEAVKFVRRLESLVKGDILGNKREILELSIDLRNAASGIRSNAISIADVADHL